MQKDCTFNLSKYLENSRKFFKMSRTTLELMLSIFLKEIEEENKNKKGGRKRSKSYEEIFIIFMKYAFSITTFDKIAIEHNLNRRTASRYFYFSLSIIINSTFNFKNNIKIKELLKRKKYKNCRCNKYYNQC